MVGNDRAFISKKYIFIGLTTCHNCTLDGSGLTIVRHSLSNDK